MSPIDENGLTEQEFLEAYEEKDYPRPSLTADICAFRSDDGVLSLLLIRRGRHPFLGCWALPGGFVNEDETADQAAMRELVEETGVEGIPCEQFGFYSDPGRDPRCRVVSQAYVALDDRGQTPRAGDDADTARWFKIERIDSEDETVFLTFVTDDVSLALSFRIAELPITGRLRAEIEDACGFAFDHAQIIADAYLQIVRRPDDMCEPRI